MRPIRVQAEREYEVRFDRWHLALQSLLDPGRSIAIVPRALLERVNNAAPWLRTIAVTDGEAQKSIESFNDVLTAVAQAGLDRSGTIVGIGGGATTDLAGFVAASYLRGISWVAVPTTVAGAVDAAIGGKTGLNLDAGKNLVGAFHSPTQVLIDQEWLETLSVRDRNAGLAESLKCGFIADGAILELVRDVTGNLPEIIWRSVAVKAAVVSKDFRESGEREILNYGHTLGHAIERHSKYSLRHGEAVAIGMRFAAELSRSVVGLSDEVVAMHHELIAALSLPDSYPSSAWPELLTLMGNDKKRSGAKLRFVTLKSIGEPTRTSDLSDQALADIYIKSVGR